MIVDDGLVPLKPGHLQWDSISKPVPSISTKCTLKFISYLQTWHIYIIMSYQKQSALDMFVEKNDYGFLFLWKEFCICWSFGTTRCLVTTVNKE